MQQTRLDETAEYSARREELRLAEVAFMRTTGEGRRTAPPAPAGRSTTVMHPSRRCGCASSSVHRTGRWSCSTSCTASARRRPARCAPCGSMGSTGSSSTSRATPISWWRRPPTPRRCGPTPATAAGTTSGGSSVAATTPSSTIEPPRTRRGHQDSTVSVFVLDPEGRLRHFSSCHPHMADDFQQRGIDLLSPVLHVLDLTPQGRGEWFAGLDY